MDKLKVLHTADWHLRDADIEECEKVVFHLIDHALETRPHLIILAGDIFDRSDVKLDSKASRLAFDAVQMLSDIAPVVILIGTKSHEAKAPELLRDMASENHRVFVSHPVLPGQIAMLHDRSFVAMPINEHEKPMAVITLVPPLTKQFIDQSFEWGDIEEADKNLSEALAVYMRQFAANAAPFKAVAPHIMVGHWTVAGCNISDHQTMIGRDIELNQSQVAAAGADLVCLGHIHYAQRIGTNIFYSGSLWRQNFGELEEKGFWKHTLTKRPEGWGLSFGFVETPTRKLARAVVDVEMPDDPGETWVPSIMGHENVAGAQVKVDVKFDQGWENQIDFEGIRAYFMEQGAQTVELVKIRKPTAAVRSEKILRLRTFTDKVAHYAEIEGHTLTDGAKDKALQLEGLTREEIINDAAKI